MAHFGIAMGAPAHTTKNLTADTIRERLVTIQLLEELDIPGIGMCLAFAKGSPYLEEPAARMKARLITEGILLSALKTWGRNLGLGSYDKFEIRDQESRQPRVGTFEWDMAAPSYLGGLARWSADTKPKPGFVVFDVLLDRVIQVSDIRPFIHKCVSLRSLKNVAGAIQFFVADKYSPDALSLAKRFGVAPATPTSLFGEEVAAALIALSATLTSAAKTAIDPEKFAELFSKLGKIEGAVNTLRGAFFEFIVADLVRKSLHATVKMNVICRYEEKAAEVDVRGIIEDQAVYFIECKGNLPGSFVADEEIEKWLTRRIPIVRKHALEQSDFRNLALHFELWTTGELTAMSRSRIESFTRQLRPNTFTVRIRLAPEIEQIAKATKDQALAKVLRQHFLAHPLANTDRSNEQENLGTLREVLSPSVTLLTEDAVKGRPPRSPDEPILRIEGTAAAAPG